MPTLSSTETKLLNALGRSTYGPQFVILCERLKKEMSEIDSITGNYEAQVEGRKLFKKLLTTMIDSMKLSDKTKQGPQGDDDYS